MLKKAFIAAAFCIPGMSAMADADNSFHYTIAANVTPFNPVEMDVTLTVKNAQVRQLASMDVPGQPGWSETIITPCEKFAARADNHARSLENVLAIMELRSSDKTEAALNLATLGSYEGGINAEESSVEACQKSASPSPANDYKTAKATIANARLHLKTLQTTLKP